MQSSGEFPAVGSGPYAEPNKGTGEHAVASDRRRFQRIELALNVVLRFPSAEAAVRSQTIDLSEGGMFIRMPNPRPEGTAIHVQLEMGRTIVEIGGIVVRTIRPGGHEAPGIGVLFTEIRDDDRDFVMSLVRGSGASH